MSKTLGPIHYQMYEKIKFQDEITSFLMDNDTSKIDEKIKPVSKKPLDEILDQENVHGFLSSKIDVVENRLNMAFSLAENIDQKLFDFGKIRANGKDFKNFNEIFEALNMFLLDGMPCDNGISYMIDENNDLFLVTNENLHKKYENFVDPKSSLTLSCGGSHDHNHDHDHHDNFDLKKDSNIDLKEENSFYHQKRLEFLKGFFDGSNYDVDLVNGINYRIYKK